MSILITDGIVYEREPVGERSKSLSEILKCNEMVKDVNCVGFLHGFNFLYDYASFCGIEFLENNEWAYVRLNENYTKIAEYTRNGQIVLNKQDYIHVDCDSDNLYTIYKISYNSIDINFNPHKINEKLTPSTLHDYNEGIVVEFMRNHVGELLIKTVTKTEAHQNTSDIKRKSFTSTEQIKKVEQLYSELIKSCR